MVVLLAVVIAAIGSHMLARWVKIKTEASELLNFGQPNGSPPAFRSGSSLADYGISWTLVAEQLGLQIKAWGVAGGSPCEFEQFQKRVPEARTTFIVVSCYDLDEAMVCDFRAAIVPLGQTVKTLQLTHASWKNSKFACSQYPMTWLRILFPTLGRSRGIMGKLREEAVMALRHTDASAGTEAGPVLELDKNGVDKYRLERISDWSKSKLVGQITALRVGMQDDQGFDGAKRLAFEHMLDYGLQRGRTIVVVLPVSPDYTQEFVSPQLARGFAAELDAVQREKPGVEWVHLDQLPGLAANEYFCDLVHMNIYGQKIATAAFQTWLNRPVHQP